MPAMAATPMPPWWSAWMAAILIRPGQGGRISAPVGTGRLPCGRRGIPCPGRNGRQLSGRPRQTGAGAVQPTYPRGGDPCDLGACCRGTGRRPAGWHYRLWPQAAGLPGTGCRADGAGNPDFQPGAPAARDNFQCAGLTGLYPCGEGAGYAGGIMTAAVDGVRCAAALMQQYAPDKA